MRHLSVDMGMARIGLAVSDLNGVIATPYIVLPSVGRTKLTSTVLEIIEKEAIEKVVIGLPLRSDGSEGDIAVKARSFAVFLSKRTSVPVILVNEAYSTVEASLLLHELNIKAREQRSVIDKAAAAVILQSYLDGKADEVNFLTNPESK